MDPSLSKAYSWKYQQQVIDAEIKSLEESIRVLRQSRNTLSPISSLPAEVIAAIFILVRLHGTGGQSDIRVTHVCRRWHEIALDHPLFWSHVNFTALRPACAAEMLARAKMAPLYLEANIPRYLSWVDAGSDAFRKELQTHVSHIYCLRISAESSHLIRILEGLTSPAPTLKHLSLSFEEGYENPPVQLSVPDTLFGSTTPKLSSLELCNCKITWKSPLLNGLKYLETIRFSEIARPNLTDWLDALDELPQLKMLLLHSASPTASLFPFDVERTVILPFLVHLDISANWMDCGLALAHLILPSLTSLRVTASSRDPTAHKLGKILPYVVQHSHGPQDAEPLQSMAITSERGRLDIRTWPTSNTNNAEGDASLSERVALSVTCKNRNLNDADDFGRILDAAVAALPLDGLVTFTSRCNTQLGLDTKFWRRHAPRWLLLKHVHLARVPARGFREMLLKDNGESECPLLPSLTTLELFGCSLSAGPAGRTLRLCDTLMKRVEQGVPLEVLDLRTCSTTSRAVQLFSEIVVDVWGPEAFSTFGTKASTSDGACGPFACDNDSRDELFLEEYNIHD